MALIAEHGSSPRRISLIRRAVDRLFSTHADELDRCRRIAAAIRRTGRSLLASFSGGLTDASAIEAAEETIAG